MVKTERRPNTATLVKPTLLDTKLLGIFDMSTVSREHLLAIKNLVHATPRCKCKPINKTISFKCESKSKDLSDPKMQKVYKALNKTYRIRTNVGQKLLDFTEDPVVEILDKVPIIPSPCITCGRQNQPERFHSHPSRVEIKQKPTKESENRKTVHKPVPMKFKSNKSKILDANKDKEKNDSVAKQQPQTSTRSKENKSPKQRADELKSNIDKENASKMKIKLTSKWKDALKKSIQRKREPNENVEISKPTISIKSPQRQLSEGGYKLDTWNPAPISGGRKRKVACYLCSQEFGTAALPSHEAQCIQKYLKETNEYIKTEDAETDESIVCEGLENWKLAWEITQASLVPCDYCDRKFLPVRLEAHKKICMSKLNKEQIKMKVPINNNLSQPGTLCEHCGKRYGSFSISIHRDQCAKKSKHMDQIEVTPRKTVITPPTVLCYICGRNFGTKSISFHEPQCLKKWKLENEKLPPHLQIPLPSKIEGQLSGKESNESQELFWKTHQEQLIACSKCARTFYPDRLEVHLKSCKGPSKTKIKQGL